MNKLLELTDAELGESMMKTWGRLRTAILINKDLDRAQALLEKFQRDLDCADITEDYFKIKFNEDEIPF